jgi:3-oxoacyl-[acyl-carrier-protein] synthase-1
VGADPYPVCVVGYGARTPLGLNALASSAAVRAGIGAIREHPCFVDKAGDPMAVAMDAMLSADLGGASRFSALAAPAIKEALAPWLALGIEPERLALFLGLPELRPGLAPDFASALTAQLQELQEIPPLRISAFCQGHSAGLIALQNAWLEIQAGRSRFCLAGGVDTYLEAETLEWLDEERQLMSAQNRSAFVPGEGAGFCLLASSAAARRHGLDVLAWVVSVATTSEENTLKMDTLSTGQGLTAAIAQATASLSLPSEKVDFTYCDLNGERYRSEEFTFALLRTQAAFVDVIDNLTPADCWGDMGAASGALFAVLAIASGQRGYAKGPRLLLWTSSQGGARSAALLRLPNPPG